MAIKTDSKLFKLVLTAMLTAVVVVFQLLGSIIRFGPFSVSLVLVPIVVGAAVCGMWSGAFLGTAFGVTVLLSGDAAPFLAINPAGTVSMVILKGLLAGFIAGVLYRLISGAGSGGFPSEGRRWAGAIVAAIVCPVINTGVFVLGCRLFFWDTLIEWASGAGFGDNVAGYLFIGMIGANFLFELLTNVVLCPVIVRLVGLVGRRR